MLFSQSLSPNNIQFDKRSCVATFLERATLGLPCVLIVIFQFVILAISHFSFAGSILVLIVLSHWSLLTFFF